MKCLSKLIYYKQLTKTGKRKLFTSLPFNFDLIEWVKSVPIKTSEKLDLIDIRTCGGKIIAEIGCHEEPGYDDTNTWAELDINFICENCKQFYHPDLPKYENDLNVWINNILDKIP